MVKKNSPWHVRAISILIVLVIYTSIVLVVSDIPGGKVLYESRQPADIKYGSFDPYVLRIVEGPIQWNMFGWHRSSLIKVTRSPDSSYGHFINIDLDISYSTDGSEAATVWSPDGVQVSYPSGHRLFIPKRAFIGGR